MYQSYPCDYSLPAEWSPQSGIMLTWPHGGTDWKPYLRQITETYLELSEIITRYEQLLIATLIVESTRRMLASRLSKEQMDRVHLYDIDSNDTWARDHGPITLVSKNSHNGLIVPIHLLDFRFNGWGEKFAWQKDNAINLQLYYQGAFQAALENHTGFVLEGGSIESDGKGTIFTTSQCLLAPHRNQPFTRRYRETIAQLFSCQAHSLARLWQFGWRRHRWTHRHHCASSASRHLALCGLR